METLRILSWVSPLLALVLGWKYRRFSLLWNYCLLGLIFDTLTYCIRFVWFPGEQVITLGNLFILIELLAFGLFFYRYVFHRNRLFALSVAAVAVIFVVHTLLNALFKFNLTALVVLPIGYIGCCLLGFNAILKEQKIQRLERSFTFWALVAIFIFAAGAFFVYLVLSQIIDNKAQDVKVIWFSIFTCINILRYLLLGIALYQKND